MGKKILMVLMGLEIGGAETHVVELSLALQQRGYQVLVASNGGVYERDLTAAGIRCYHAPLHRRHPVLMLRSFGILRKILRTERPDLVHAHARIPAFLSGILCRRMDIPFVTTAHYDFQVNPALRLLSDWGEQTVAVSQDIVRYLRERYDLPEQQIHPTINGIDTEKFSPAVSGAAVREEFGIGPENPLLVHVSRLDAGSSLAARQLIEIVPRLHAEVPGLRLLVVGTGDVAEELNRRADAVNGAAGECVVTMTGPRTDIPALLASGDLFVGVSRAALEAMAAERPVILAGSQGFLGIFREGMLPVAQDSNFCCRDCEASTEDRLFSAVLDLLHTPAEQRKALGSYGRRVVLENYSVDRMATDCERAYRAALAAHTRVVVSGYYGFRNLGDDAILLSLREQIQALLPGAKIVALSRRPKETEKACGVAAVNRFRPLKVLRAVKSATCFVSGGGSLLQDHTSTRSLLYYTALIHLAKRRGKPVMFYANGIGPVQLEKNRIRVRAAAESADVITLRDSTSLEELREMGVQNPEIHVTADPVFACGRADPAHGRSLLDARGIPGDRPLIGISLRKSRGQCLDLEEMARFCDGLSPGYAVVFLVMQQPGDRLVAEEVEAKMHSSAWILESPYDPRGMMDMLSCMEAVVSMRLHSLIFAACVHVPVLAVSYDPKVSACAVELGMPDAGAPENLDADGLRAALEDLIARREDCVRRLEETTETLSELARENGSALMELLKSR